MTVNPGPHFAFNPELPEGVAAPQPMSLLCPKLEDLSAPMALAEGALLDADLPTFNGSEA